MADGGVVVKILSNVRGAKAPCCSTSVPSRKSPGIGISLTTPLESVQNLQKTLQAKAKGNATAKFHSLWDKVCRPDVLVEAYRRCRLNRGAPGVDGESFATIEQQGLGLWLRRLKQELSTKQYRCSPLLRVWIPKANGGQRPLSIPTIKDRVVQTAVLLVINPVFDTDLSPRQYGFRSHIDAKMAIRRVYFSISERFAREVVDADLSDYFSTIPHGQLMKCIARRITDGSVLGIIRQWLRAPVVERTRQGVEIRTTVARNTHRGTAQGSPISPLLGNLYFRRFILAWNSGTPFWEKNSEIVNYADDLVILCKRGTGEQAMTRMKCLMERLGLTVNESKTRLVVLPEGYFDFLGYTIGRFYGKGGRPYWGTAISRKAIKRLKQEIHAQTTSRWNCTPIAERAERLNPLLRGWASYFNQGPVLQIYRDIDIYTARRVRIWLQRRKGQRGTGYRQYPDQYLYEQLGLIRLLDLPRNRPNAKV